MYVTNKKTFSRFSNYTSLYDIKFLNVSNAQKHGMATNRFGLSRNYKFI